MIVAIFLLAVFLQISISSFGELFLRVNFPLVFGILVALLRRPGGTPLEYYFLVAGIILDIISALPFGVFTLSFFVTFLIVRFFLNVIHRETAVVTGGLVFLGSVLFRIIQRFLFFSSGFTGGDFSGISVGGEGGLDIPAVLIENLKGIVLGALTDVIVAEVILAICFIGRRYVFRMKHIVLDRNASLS